MQNKFGNKYAKDGPFKERTQDTANTQNHGKNQDLNTIAHYSFDKIILKKSENEILALKLKDMSMRTPIVKLMKKSCIS